MIEALAPVAAMDTRNQPASRLDQMRCSRCGGGLARVHLTLGSVVEMRCHHSIRNPDGKRETCGWVNTVRPSR